MVLAGAGKDSVGGGGEECWEPEGRSRPGEQGPGKENCGPALGQGGDPGPDQRRCWGSGR